MFGNKIQTETRPPPSSIIQKPRKAGVPKIVRQENIKGVQFLEGQCYFKMDFRDDRAIFKLGGLI
jgi:hypothetical protein